MDKTMPPYANARKMAVRGKLLPPTQPPDT